MTETITAPPPATAGHPPAQLGGGAAEIVCDWADSFIEHWRSDEGQDPSDQAAADLAAADMERFRPFLVAAATAYAPDAIRHVCFHLRIARAALVTARDVLTTAAETHPDQGDGSDVSPTHSGGIAGDCEAAAQEAVEGLWFIDQVLATLPDVIAADPDEAKAIAIARDDRLLIVPEADLRTVGWAVQWAGHFGLICGAEAGGPAFSTIAGATAIIEECGVTIPHSRSARDLIAVTNDMRDRRRAEVTNATKGEGK